MVSAGWCANVAVVIHIKMELAFISFLMIFLKKRADQVRKARDKWEPNEHSVLCCKHLKTTIFNKELSFPSLLV